MEKSAEGIVGRHQVRLLRHSKAERAEQQIGQAVTVVSEGPNGSPARGLKERRSGLSWNNGTASGESIGRQPGGWDETGVGATREDAPVGTGRPPIRIVSFDSICRTAVYVIRMYGGVGGGSREASPYPD